MSGLFDPAEHGRLLEARAELAGRPLRRLRRAPCFSPALRTLLGTLPARTVVAPLVALIDELDEYAALAARFADHLAGDGEALPELVDHFVSSEHVLALMPKGRLPRQPAPSVRRLLQEIEGELVGRLVIQWALDGMPRPRRPGELSFAPRYSPSWGHTSHSLLLGRGRIVVVGRAPLPRRFRFSWDARGYALVGVGRPPLEIHGEWEHPGQWAIRAPERQLLLVPHAGPFPLLPPVVDEDGESKRRRYPAPGSPRHGDQLFAAAGAQRRRIETALAVLAAAWPAGAATVHAFTRAIIPVTQPEVVSYSFAPVPGWSYINLYDRDFVDLVDDLAHENAHHHLNHLLAREAMLLPPGDEPLLFYSPWRETLRPLRGIFHAVFTFHVGAELFAHLYAALEEGLPLPYRFRAAERRKIAGRCLEELVQVRYSLVDLRHARREGRITDAGERLVATMARRLQALARLEPSLRRSISGTPWARRLEALEARLDEQRRLGRRAGIDAQAGADGHD